MPDNITAWANDLSADIAAMCDGDRHALQRNYPVQTRNVYRIEDALLWAGFVARYGQGEA